MGDIAGAAVEAQPPGYIARTYRSVDDILRTRSVPEFVGRIEASNVMAHLPKGAARVIGVAILLLTVAVSIAR